MTAIPGRSRSAGRVEIIAADERDTTDPGGDIGVIGSNGSSVTAFMPRKDCGPKPSRCGVGGDGRANR